MTDSGYRLTGHKTLALQSVGADAVIFPCFGPEGFVAFLIVPDATNGTVRHDYRLIDGSLGTEFRFTDAEVADEAKMDVTWEDWVRAKAWGDIGHCAEMLGIMGKVLNETADHLRTRKQFGVPIGTFQALQHQMARMVMGYEKARALLHRAAATPPDRDWLNAVGDCRHFMNEFAVHLGEVCVHLHGGMGVTDELYAACALKRLILLNNLITLHARGSAPH